MADNMNRRPASDGTAAEGQTGQDDHRKDTGQPCPTLAAEAAVLGAMLWSSDARDGVPRYVGPDDFQRHAHRVLFEALVRMHRAGEVVDHVTVGSELHFRDQLDEIGGTVALHELTDPLTTPAPSSWPAYATRVARAAASRRLIARLKVAIERCQAGEDPAVVARWIGGGA